MDGLNPEALALLFGDTFVKQMTLFSAAFSLAAWIHSGRVKKEIRIQMEPLTKAIVDLGAALREDLRVLSERTGKVEDGLADLKDRINKIETKE